MNARRFLKYVSCPLWKGVKPPQYRQLSMFPPVCNKYTSGVTKIRDFGKSLTTILETFTDGAVFAGAGQYHPAEEDRIVVLHFGENFLTNTIVSQFETKTILDGCVPNSDVDLVMDSVKQHSSLPVYNGELDFINSSPWQFGFTLKPFSIFSAEERICLIKNDKTVATNINGRLEVIPLQDIDFVGLAVSDEPYNNQRLFIRLKSKETKTLIEIERSHEACDLAKLTVDTEWLMKAAALLCLNLNKQSGDNIQLKMSAPLQPINNPWVAQRQKIWIDLIRKSG